MHAVCAEALWNLPSSHAAHSWLPVSLAYVPALHGVASAAPAKQKWPASQAVQSASAELRHVATEVPAGHGSCAAAPATQYEPGAQSSHPV